jgi:hypothetical protein
VAIHAAKRRPSDLFDRGLLTWDIYRTACEDLGVTELDLLPRQYILCVCELRECVPVERFHASGRDPMYGDYSFGRFAWVLGIPKLVEPPMPQGGRQGLWTLDLHQENLLELWPGPRGP